jgi:hypothetical protein
VTGSAYDIATVLVGMFSPTKAQDIALRMLDKLKARKSKAAKADKQGKQMGRPRLSADHVLTPGRAAAALSRDVQKANGGLAGARQPEPQLLD